MPAHRHLIICGAEKAGTTSLYTYLVAHPAVVGSIEKESDFFRNASVSYAGYRACFPTDAPSDKLLMEASPGYLAEAETVAPRLYQHVPDARLVFVLRDPIDRLRSSFRFYKSRLHVPDDMSMTDFVDRCLRFDGTEAGAQALGLKPWHLRALERGRYDLAVPAFEKHFSSAQVLLLSFNDLHRQTQGAMERICQLSGIEGSFYNSYVFSSENAGFVVKARGVQAVALFLNNRFQRFWRTHPGLKRRLLSVYKRFNADTHAQPDTLPPALQARLQEFYAPTYQFMANRLGTTPPGTPAKARSADTAH
jgi:hypothetical protein